MKILTTIRNIIIVFIIICLVTAAIDYIRIKNAKEPVFCLKTYQPIGEKLKYRGLFYRAERVIKGNINESMTQSYNVKYTFIYKTINITYNIERNIEDKLVLVEKKECDNDFQEYISIEGLTIYTNCLNNIKIKNNGKKAKDLSKELESDPLLIESIINKMTFMGMIDSSIEKYNSKDTFANKPFTIYRCTDYSIVYITDREYYNDKVCRSNKLN